MTPKYQHAETIPNLSQQLPISAAEILAIRDHHHFIGLEQVQQGATTLDVSSFGTYDL
jgi:hypothetical protein